MNLEIDSNGLTAKNRTGKGSSGCLVKRASEGSSSNNSSTDKSDVSANEDLGKVPGLVINGSSIDQNQNCTAVPHVTAAAVFPQEEEDDSIRLTPDDARKPTEEELLRQLEEANRLLEADEKSHAARAMFSTTPGHSRKGSESSIVSSTSSNSFYSQQNSNKVEDSNEDLDPGGSPSLSAKQGKLFRKPFIARLTKQSSTSEPSRRSSLGDAVVVSPTQLKHMHGASLRSSSTADHGDASYPDDHVFSGHPSETLWEIWGRIINDWDSVKKKPAFLRELVRKGIPHEFRGMAWQLILGVHDSVWKQEYAEHMKKKSPCEKLIRRDIARTFPDHDFFKEKDGFGQESLFNVMKAYSLHDREVGYCQGSGFIVGLLLMQMPEEDAFAVLVHLMQEFRLRELFKPSMAELGLCMFKLECLIQELLPTLLVHFQTQNFDTSMYASSWFLTLYVTSLPLSLARRIMDLFISEGMEMIFRVGVAILQSCQEELLTLDMEGLLKYLQKDLRSRFEQEIDQDNLLHTAYNIKYSHKKMKKLEKEYTALKTKENEDQIELRRLRTENRLLRQRIENLEKVEAKLLRQNEESSTLADKLVQDQVTWAQEAEQSYALKNEISILHQQLKETQKKLFEAEDIIGDIRTRTRIIEDAVHLDEAEERNMVKHLQEELIAVRLRETDTAITIKELKQKIADLEDSNLRLQRAPSNDVQQLQEELIAVKLREAEANLSLKELRMKVNEIESYWEAHMERVRQSSPKEKGTKMEIRHLQEEVMALKLKEARAVADVKDVKQKLMELETQNHICTNQIRRIGEENKDLKKQLEEATEREKDLRTNIKDLTRKLDDTETKRKEEIMMARIRDAENVQLLAELRHKFAEIDIQKEEVLAAGQLQDKGENQELKNKLHDLQDEVLQLQLSMSNRLVRPGRCVMTDSYLGNNSDEELDAEIKDSENLDRTLSDIIEGKSHSPSRSSVHENESCSNTDSSSMSAHSQKLSDSLVQPSEFLHRRVNDDNLSSHLQRASADFSAVGGISRSATDRDVNRTTTARPSGDSRDSFNLLQYSGESNVIEDCDSAQICSGDDSDLKGKTFRPLNPTAAKRAFSVENVSMKDISSLSTFRTVESAKHGPDDKVYKTDISDPDHCFPETWELYEEVVEVNSNMEARVISRISADRDIVKGADFGSSSDRLYGTDISNCSTSSRNSMERRSDKKTDNISTKTSVLSKTQIDSSTDGRNSRHDRRSISSKEKEFALDLSNSESNNVDKIPDVVVIYEPSCAASSLICGCEEDDDQDFMLKESTV